MSRKHLIPCLSLVAALAGCGHPALHGFDAGSDAGSACDSPRQMCGSRCVDVVTDPQNCGGCGQLCSSGMVCNQGSCSANCDQALMACGSSCVDLSSDANHCGDCSTSCRSDQVCVGGGCGCGPGKSDCGGGVCVDTKSDPQNCGLCGRACPSGVSCRVGSCLSGGDGAVPVVDGGGSPFDAGVDYDGGGTGCGAGMTYCGGACVDTASDSMNCGSCGNTCASGQVCSSSSCTGGSTCTPDLAEPDDTQGSAYALANFTNSPNTTMHFDSFNMGSDGDVDWYRFAVSDMDLYADPIVEVTLDNVPSGSDYDLGAWWSCDTGTVTMSCGAGSSDTLSASFEGCTSTNSGNASEHVTLDENCTGTYVDNGVVLVRVNPYIWGGSCAPYHLTIYVH